MAMSQRHSKRSANAAATPPVTPTDPAEAVTVGARRVVAAITDPGDRSRDQWLGVVGDCQLLINTLTAVQDTAIAQAARRESVWCEDGTLGESVHAPGRVTLDAADVLAPVIGATHSQAERRVEQAVRLAARRVPVPADARDLPDASGLGGLHQAMAAGHLDGYRAGVIAFELEIAPADVADAVVAALSGHFGEDSTSLRRRTRVLLSRISSDLVRERARKARANTGLRRWVAEPGVDEWHGTFPSEDAACAWAAIDKLAHDLVAAGTCTNIEQARGKALTDLVTGNATIDVQIVLTVPADTQPAPLNPEATVAATEPQAHAPAMSADGEGSTAPTAVAVAGSAALTTDEGAVTASELTSGQPVDGKAIAHDASATGTEGLPTPAAYTDNPATSTTGADDLIAVQGSRPSEPLLIRRGWLRDHLAKQPPRPKRGRTKLTPPFVPCDPLTGARLDPADHLTTDAYRPGPELTALVKARDGRCRFPGCCVAARFCDLDHVRPWPAGRTNATNLLTLCRRHHRIKQRPGWKLRLAPDGTATWTDPTGRVRTTAPLDALTPLVLTADAAPTRPATQPTPEVVTTATSTAWSALETHLEFTADHHPHHDHDHRRWLPATHRRCTNAADLRVGLARHAAKAPAFPDVPPF